MSSRLCLGSGLLLIGCAVFWFLSENETAIVDRSARSRLNRAMKVEPIDSRVTIDSRDEATEHRSAVRMQSAGSGVADVLPNGVKGRPELIQRRQMRSRGDFREPLIFAMENEELIQKVPEFSEEGIEKLRNEFIENAGVDQFAPTDPEYAKRWVQAEVTLEEKIRSLYGWGAWSAYQRERAVERYQAAELR